MQAHRPGYHQARAGGVVLGGALSGTLIEVQIRTELQHLWAELSEKLADTIDPAIKYGGGTGRVRDQLAYLSTGIELLDAVEMQAEKIGNLPERTPEQEESLVQARRKLDEARPLLRDGIRELISLV